MSRNENTSSIPTNQGGGGGGTCGLGGLGYNSKQEDPSGNSGKVKSGTINTTRSAIDDELIFQMDDIDVGGSTGTCSDSGPS